MRPRGLHRLACVLGKRATLGAMSTIACAAVLASCGEDSSEDEGSIPSETASSIQTKLDEVEAQFSDGQCEEAEATATQIQAAIGALGTNVKGQLEEALVEASGNLVTLVREDCEPVDKPSDSDEDGDEAPTGATGPDGAGAP
jgi:hypothetical protein